MHLENLTCRIKIWEKCVNMRVENALLLISLTFYKNDSFFPVLIDLLCHLDAVLCFIDIDDFFLNCNYVLRFIFG